LVANLSYRSNLRQSRENCRDFVAMQPRPVTADLHRVDPRSKTPRIPQPARVTPQSSMADA
jgi:hypothetical protein